MNNNEVKLNKTAFTAFASFEQADEADTAHWRTASFDERLLVLELMP